jgi:hypothetical protein
MIKYSVTGIPYIPIDEKSMLIFSGIGYETYKRFTYAGQATISFKLKNGRNGDAAEIRETKQRIGFSVGLTFFKIPREASRVSFPSQKTRSAISGAIKKYLDENKELPKNRIKDVEKDLAEIPMELE